MEQLLADSPPEVYQLMGEVLYVSYLIVSKSAIGGAKKKERINQVLGWSPTSAAIPDDCVDGLTPGVAHPGAFFIANFPIHPGYIIEMVEQWKEQAPDERLLDHNDPEAAWEFKKFVRGVDWRGVLQSGYPNSPTAQREALLHLVHPDTFEAIVNTDHKNKIASAFANYVKEPSDDVDRKIMQIRQGIEAELGRDFKFFDQEIVWKWRDPTGPWDEFVRRARQYVDSGRLESEEIEYKAEIGRRLVAAREAVLANSDDWGRLVNAGMINSNNNLIHYIQISKFHDWVKESPNDTLTALQALWTQDDVSVTDRITAFCNLFPWSVTGGAGTRMTTASVLLMGLDVEQYPPFRVGVFNEAYERTGYDKPERDADEAALYEHALGFLDRFIEEAAERGLTLRHRLDAQSVVWGISGEPPPPPPPCHDLQALATDLHLPVKFLENIDTLLRDKKQVIFQGPPGTGKTYVAQKLAACLAGSDDRVTLVQFHPSYAYEDFVQGFRPALVNGQPGFELRDGPLLRAAEQAREEPDADHFLVIDEINRGNLAKVFGELYFLLEYRDSEMQLQYKEEKFSLPKNLYIIGTMNTADRSIALVDLALRRRFYFVEFHPDDEPVKGVLRRWLKANGLDHMVWVADVVDRANDRLKDDLHAAIGPSYFMKPGLDEAAVERIWKHSILPYVEERRFGGGERAEDFGLDGLRRAGVSGGSQDEQSGDAGANGNGDVGDDGNQNDGANDA